MERIREALEKAQQDRESALQSQQNNAEPPAGVDLAAADVAIVEESDTGDTLVQAVMPEAATPEVPAGETTADGVRVIPVSRETFEENLLVAAIADNPYRDTYRMLRSRLLEQMETNNWTKIGITSPTAGAGKTLTTVNLAISMALDMRASVLLIDADLRRPTVHKYFGVELERGISDYLQDGGDWKDLLFNPGIDRLTVLPGCNPVLDSSELLRSPRADELAAELMGNYKNTIVVVDMPPVLEVDDAIAYGRNLDCLLMVAENGSTRAADLQSAMDMLSERSIIGTVLNKCPGKPRARY